MSMPTANGGIAQQAADSNDAEKNIFSGEARGDDKGRAGDDKDRAGDDKGRADDDKGRVGDGERRADNDQRRSNNDPRHTKQPRQNNQPRRDKRDVHGWVILDKPIGMTSTHAVAVLKRLFQAKRAGHAGTLDPLASGGLPIALGEATKTVPFVMDGRKRYRFTVAWGEERDTDDTEGRVTHTSELRPSAGPR